MPDANESEWMTPEEAAAYLRLKLQTIHNKVSSGTIPFHRPSPRMLRFNRAELDEWLRGNPVTL